MSNKLPFNKALIKKDMKILFPLFCANVIMLILSFPFRYMQAIAQLKDIDVSSNNISHLIYSIGNRVEDIFAFSVFSIIVSIIATIILFANEKNKKTIEMISVMPFSRREIYINKVIVGLLVTIIPTMLIYILSYFILASNPFIFSIANLNNIRWIFIISASFQLIIFSYCVMISMLFGSVISTLVCGGIFSLYPAAFFLMLQGVTNFIPEYILEMSFKITPFARFIHGMIDTSSVWLYSVIFSIIFILAGYFLFEMYKMEKNSEFLTFKWTEKVFKIGVLISAALLGANMLNVILIDISRFEALNKILGLLIGAGFGYFIPKAIISRNKAA